MFSIMFYRYSLTVKIYLLKTINAYGKFTYVFIIKTIH